MRQLGPQLGVRDEVSRQALAGAEKTGQHAQKLAFFAQKREQSQRGPQGEIAKECQRAIGIGRRDGFFQPFGRHSAARDFKVVGALFDVAKAGGAQFAFQHVACGRGCEHAQHGGGWTRRRLTQGVGDGRYGRALLLDHGRERIRADETEAPGQTGDPIFVGGHAVGLLSVFELETMFDPAQQAIGRG